MFFPVFAYLTVTTSQSAMAAGSVPTERAPPMPCGVNSLYAQEKCQGKWAGLACGQTALADQSRGLACGRLQVAAETGTRLPSGTLRVCHSGGL